MAHPGNQLKIPGSDGIKSLVVTNLLSQLALC